MQAGNGIDLTAIHQLLTEVAQTVRGHGERFDALDARLDRVEARLDRVEARLDGHDGKFNQIITVINEHTRRFDAVATVLDEHTRKIDDLTAGLAALRNTVADYHESVVRHGVWLTELGDRLRRIERHLGLDPLPTTG